MQRCELCGREVSGVSRHHLLPLQKGGKYSPTVLLCQPCHSTIHHTFTNTELAQKYNTVEKLKQAEAMQAYLKWITTKTLEKIQVKRRKKN